MDIILEAIKTVGFPIVAYVILFWYMVEQRKDHKEEVQKMTEAVNNNTIILQKLCDNLNLEANLITSNLNDKEET